MHLYAQAIPQAIVRTATGGHQLDGDLSLVAADIENLSGTLTPSPASRGTPVAARIGPVTTENPTPRGG